MKQCFLDELRGSLSGAEGAFGIFETFHVVKYYKNAKAFVTAEGIVLTQAYVEIEKKGEHYYIPIDLKFFGGEKIVHINNHVWDAYVTKTGRVILTRGMYKESKEFQINWNVIVFAFLLNFNVCLSKNYSFSSYKCLCILV
ncbi:MAG: hypothetical protein EZS28_052191, partial [Streblomastix strix]